MQTWFPRDVIARARQQPCEVFTRAYRSPYFLVVILDAPTSELALGLKGEKASEQDGLPFRTATLNSGGSSMFPRPVDRRVPAASAERHKQVVESLVELGKLCCHIIPVRKRVETAASISLGRSRTHDIVLRHASVSKLHAQLEIEDGRLFVTDAGSRNHTFLNDERIEGRVEIHSGDNLRFGWVEALVCTDDSLWTAARSG